MEERVKNWHELLGFMEQYMYPKCLGLAALINLEDHIMTRRFKILKVYVHMYSTLGSCRKGWYVRWDNENYRLMVACG